MKRFAALLTQIAAQQDATDVFAGYLRHAPENDRLWAIGLLSGKRPKRVLPASAIRALAVQASGLPDWLFDASLKVVGDLVETAALIQPAGQTHEEHSLTHCIQTLNPISNLCDDTRNAAIIAAWRNLPSEQRFWFTKLLTGGFRATLPARTIANAVAQVTGEPATDVAIRLAQPWQPDTTTWHDLLIAENPAAINLRPAPMRPPQDIENPKGIGPAEEWRAFHQYHGISGQIVLRGGSHAFWAHDETLLTDRFPELKSLVDALPDNTVLTGDVVATRDGIAHPDALQKRMTGKPTKRAQSDAPVTFIVHDILRYDGQSMQEITLDSHQKTLKQINKISNACLPKEIPFATWADLAREHARCHSRGATGLRLVSRESGAAYHWIASPLTITAVLLYVQSGRGSGFDTFSFAVRDGNGLTPITKTAVQLDADDLTELSAWIRAHITDKFGPVRQVKPQHVFQIACDGISASTRHKSGLALRNPVMVRWDKEKSVSDAHSLTDLKDMLAHHG